MDVKRETHEKNKGFTELVGRDALCIAHMVYNMSKHMVYSLCGPINVLRSNQSLSEIDGSHTEGAIVEVNRILPRIRKLEVGSSESLREIVAMPTNANVALVVDPSKPSSIRIIRFRGLLKERPAADFIVLGRDIKAKRGVGTFVVVLILPVVKCLLRIT